MRIVGIIVFFLIIYGSASPPLLAQHDNAIIMQKVDSLKKEIYKAKNDTSQVLIYTEIARHLYNIDTTQAIYYAQKALEVSKRQNYLKGLAEGLNVVGWVREYQGNYQKALELYAESYKIYQQIYDVKGITRVLNDIGIVQNGLGNFKEAIEAYQAALKIHEKNKNQAGKTNVLNNLGLVYNALGDYENALKCLFESVSISQKLGEYEILGANYNNIGDVYEAKGDWDKALEYQLKSAEISKEKGDKHTLVAAYTSIGSLYIRKEEYEKSQLYLEKALSIAHSIADITKESLVYGILGELYERKKSYPKALGSYQKALKMYNSLGDKHNKVSVLLGLGRIYLQLKNYELAKKYLLEALDLAQTIGVRRMMMEIYEQLSILYEQLGNFSQALFYHKKFKLHNDSLFNLESESKMQKLRLAFEIEEKERENYSLRKEKDAQNKIISLQRKDAQLERLVFYGMVAMLLLAVLLIYTFYRGRQKLKTMNAQLSLKSQEILQKKEEIEAILEEVTQTNETLSAQKLKLEELNREKDGLIGVVAHDLKAPLNRTQALVRMLGLEGTLNEMQKKYVEMIDVEIENARKLIRDLLDTSALEHHGSKVSITSFDVGQLCKELVEFYQTPAQEKHLKIHFIQSYEKDSPLIMTSDRDFLRRILDNLLSNAVKFSPPEKNIFLSLSEENQHVVIRVKDEGIGFTEEDKTKMFKKFQKLSAKPTGGESSTGLGLSIIKSLVEKLNGEISLESEWQKGAEFIVKIPLVYQN